VIESGEVFTNKHLDMLTATLDEIDSNKDEVKQFLSLLRGFLGAKK
jgi:hypothetical protein